MFVIDQVRQWWWSDARAIAALTRRVETLEKESAVLWNALLLLSRYVTSRAAPVKGQIGFGRPVRQSEATTQGEKGMVQLQDSQKIPYFVTELDAAGVVVMDQGDSATVTVDANATVAPDAQADPAKVPSGVDPAKVLQTGYIVAAKSAGPVNVTVTYTHTDGTPVPPPVTAQLEVVAGAPATGAVGFGVPVGQ